MEEDLQSLFGLHVTGCAQQYSLTETPQLPPPPQLDSYYEGAISQKDRRHIFETPWRRYTQLWVFGDVNDTGDISSPVSLLPAINYRW